MDLKRHIALVFGCAVTLQSTGQVLYNGATISMSSGANLILNGTSIENHGSVAADPHSTVVSLGNQLIEVRGTQGLSLGMVVVNNRANVVLMNPLNIDKKMTFARGKVISSAESPIAFGVNAVSNPVNDSSFVTGPVQKEGLTAFVFPVGGSSISRPATLSNIASSDVFTVRYYQANPNENGMSASALDDSLKVVSQCEYWTFAAASGSTAKITLSWDNTASCGVNTVGDLRVANWNGSNWTNQGRTLLSGTSDAGSLTTSTNPTLTNSPSAYTLGSVTANNPLPIELLYFYALLDEHGKSATLYWSSATEVDADCYTIEQSRDAVNYLVLETIPSAGTTNAPRTYTLNDKSPDDVNFYALYGTDINGHREHLADALLLNPNENEVTFQLGDHYIKAIGLYDASEVRLVIYDASGKIYSNELIGIDPHAELIVLPAPTDLEGIYIAQILYNMRSTTAKVRLHH
jgi:hypothetical protein